MSRRLVPLAALLWLAIAGASTSGASAGGASIAGAAVAGASTGGASAAEGPPAIPEPVFVQDAGATGGELAVAPPLGELPTGPSMWRLDATNGGDVTLVLDVAVTVAEAGPDGAPSPGLTPSWVALPAARIQLAPGEVAQFGVAVDPRAGEGGVLLLTLKSTNVEPEVRVTALAAIGGFDTAAVEAEVVDNDGIIDTVVLRATGARPSLARIEVERSRLPFGIGHRQLGVVTGLVVLPGAPLQVDVTSFDGPTKVTVHSGGRSTTLSVATTNTLLVAATVGAAALLGGGTVAWLRRRRR